VPDRHVRSTPRSRRHQANAACLKSARNGHRPDSFDHLIGARAALIAPLSGCLSWFEIDDKAVLARRVHGKTDRDFNPYDQKIKSIRKSGNYLYPSIASPLTSGSRPRRSPAASRIAEVNLSKILTTAARSRWVCSAISAKTDQYWPANGNSKINASCHHRSFNRHINGD
jgi:hypothetical protein